MPDEPVERTFYTPDQPLPPDPVEEGHPAAGAAFEANPQANQEIREGPAPELPEWMTQPNPAYRTVGVVQGVREGPAEQAPIPETKEEDIERKVTWEEHRNFCHSPDMKDRLVIMKHIDYGYCKLDANSRKRWVKSIGSAQRFEVNSSFIQGRCGWGDTLIELLLIKEAPQIPGCKLTDWFDGGFITLMNDAPNNAVMRAHMMRVLKIEPARELDTFEKLKEWVEKTFPKPKKNRHRASAFSATGLDNLAVPMPTRPRTPMVEIGYRMNEREHGRCDYSVERTATTTLEMTVNMIRSGIDQGDITNLDDLAEFAMEEARMDEDVDWEWGNVETHQYESSGSENFRIRLRNEFPTAQIADMLRQNAPELLEQIGLT